MKKLLALALLAALGGIGAWFFAAPAPKAPEVTFSTLSGKQLALSELRGKVVLVKFWATNCVSCVAQMPDNIENYNKYREQGFELVAVAMQYDPANYVINCGNAQATVSCGARHSRRRSKSLWRCEAHSNGVPDR